MGMVVRKLGKVAVHVAQEELFSIFQNNQPTLILKVTGNHNWHNWQSQQLPDWRQETIQVHVLCLYTNSEVTRFFILKDMTIKEHLTANWNYFTFIVKRWRWGKGKWNISIAEDLNKAKLNHFNSMEIWLHKFEKSSFNHGYISLIRVKICDLCKAASKKEETYCTFAAILLGKKLVIRNSVDIYIKEWIKFSWV